MLDVQNCRNWWNIKCLTSVHINLDVLKEPGEKEKRLPEGDLPIGKVKLGKTLRVIGGAL